MNISYCSADAYGIDPVSEQIRFDCNDYSISQRQHYHNENDKTAHPPLGFKEL